MKPQIREQLVKALRSGEYKQGHDQLRNKENGMCCLGVLCDIAEKAGIGSWVEITPEAREMYPILRNESRGGWFFLTPSTRGAKDSFAYSGANGFHYPPVEVITWAGLNDYRGDLKERVEVQRDPVDQNWKTEVSSLAHMNDVRQSFEQIADVIVKQEL